MPKTVIDIAYNIVFVLCCFQRRRWGECKMITYQQAAPRTARILFAEFMHEWGCKWDTKLPCVLCNCAENQGNEKVGAHNAIQWQKPSVCAMKEITLSWLGFLAILAHIFIGRKKKEIFVFNYLVSMLAYQAATAVREDLNEKVHQKCKKHSTINNTTYFLHFLLPSHRHPIKTMIVSQRNRGQWDVCWWHKSKVTPEDRSRLGRGNGS